MPHIQHIKPQLDTCCVHSLHLCTVAAVHRACAISARQGDQAWGAAPSFSPPRRPLRLNGCRSGTARQLRHVFRESLCREFDAFGPGEIRM